MSEHPNVARIRAGYGALSRGDVAVTNDLFAEDMVLHATGRNQITGEYRGRDEVYRVLAKLAEITGGTLHYDVHAVFADDEHGVALVTAKGSRDGQTGEFDVAHVARLRDGKIVEFWDCPYDRYGLDEFIG